MSNNSILELTDILNEYSKDIQDGITKAAETIAKNGANELKKKSPKRTGRYGKGWKVDNKKGNGFVHTTIYNSTSWQLTHLLEKPHLLRNGKKSNPIIHIEPVEQKCISDFQKEVEHIIKNGG